MVEKKMPFYMVCKGSFAKKMQEIFEDAQIKCQELKGPVKITGSILICPSADGDESFGTVSYETRMLLPPEKSGKYTTILKSGLIIEDGESIEDVLQLSLPFMEMRKKEATEE